jgi:hypothetical protein
LAADALVEREGVVAADERRRAGLGEINRMQ